jgi:hypothetical protein
MQSWGHHNLNKQKKNNVPTSCAVLPSMMMVLFSMGLRQMAHTGFGMHLEWASIPSHVSQESSFANGWLHIWHTQHLRKRVRVLAHCHSVYQLRSPMMIQNVGHAHSLALTNQLLARAAHRLAAGHLHVVGRALGVVPAMDASK